MADYLSFADGVPISDPVSSDSDEELNLTDLTLDEEPEVRFNDPDLSMENLATAPVPAPESSTDPKVGQKYPRDDAQSEEELIEGSGPFAKRPRILGCPNMKKWLMKNKKHASLQDPDIRDHCVESLRFSSDV